VNRRVGEYELVQRIGHGGMAEVWMGRRALVGGATKSVAIKFIAAGMAGNERHRKMFLDEARLSMLLSHSNIVQVFDAGMDGDRLFMAMEWVDGLDLSHICNLARASGQQLSWSIVGFAIGEVLQGLSYAHTLRHEGRQLGIIHRDISPHNVLVSLSGEVKLADFGIARLSSEETSGVHIKGKLRYMAPEHLAGRTKSAKVDLFGAGAILHELVSGEKFRAGADEMALYHQILEGVTPELVRTDVPPELVALRNALLEPDENRRVPTAEDALAMLEAWPGYRNAKGELARLCRSFMGVDAPRSGLHVRPDVAAVASSAGSSMATAPTHTAAQSQVPTVASASRSTASVGGVDALDRGPARWMWVAGGAGAVALAGATAWAVVTFARGDAADTSAPAVTAQVDDAKPDAKVDAKVEDAKVGDTKVGDAKVEDAKVEDAKVDDTKVDDTKVDDTKVDDTKVDDTRIDDTKIDDASPAADPTPLASTKATPTKAEPKPTAKPSTKPAKPEPTAPRPAAKLEVLFRVASPLRFAWVRIDGGSAIAVEPRATRSISPGRHTIDWRADEAKPWVAGGSFDFAPGTSPRVRVTSAGPKLE
jgi:serine/threonine protein kinase